MQILTPSTLFGCDEILARGNNNVQGTGGAPFPSKCRCLGRFFQRGKDEHGIRSAAVWAVVGLALEVVTTLWAFGQARAAGALDSDVQCESSYILESFHRSKVTQEKCEEMDSSLLEEAKNFFENSYFTIGCGNPTVPSTEEDSFLELCSCDDTETSSSYWQVQECVWTGVEFPLIPELSGLCFAFAFSVFYDDDTDDTPWLTDANPFVSSCWPKNASGTATITIIALSVALASIFVEGFVTRQYFKDTQKGPNLRTAASVFEAVGVVAVFAVLVTLPSYYGHEKVLHGLAIFAATSAVSGGLAEVLATFLKRGPRQQCGCTLCGLSCGTAVRGRFLERAGPGDRVVHYSGALGSAAIWVGAAMLEVVIATYLVWKKEGRISSNFYPSSAVDSADWDGFNAELASQIALEVITVMVMWGMKISWARVKLSLGVK